MNRFNNRLRPVVSHVLTACALMLCSGAAVQAQERLQVLGVDGVVERASGPAELIRLDSEGRITVRALRGFGQLPETYGKLALTLRGMGVDLMAADAQQLRELIARAEGGDLKTDPQPLRALLALIEQREYLEWTPVQAGEALEVGEGGLLRGAGTVRVQAEDGRVLALQSATEVGTLAALASSAAPVAADAAPATASLAAAPEAAPQPAPALSAADFSPRAARLFNSRMASAPVDGSGVVLAAPVQFVEGDDGKVRIVYPGVRLADNDAFGGMGSAGEAGLELGDLVFEAAPLDAEGVRWQLAMHFPEQMRMLDAMGREVGRLQAARRDVAFEFNTAADTATTLDAAFERIELSLAEAGPDEPERIVLAGFDMTMKLSENASQRWSGPLRMDMRELSFLDAAGQPLLGLRGASMEATYRNVDLAGLSEASRDMENMVTNWDEQQPEAIFDALPRLFGRMIDATGHVEGQARLTGLTVDPRAGGTAMQLDALTLGGVFAPSEGKPSARDLAFSYALDGFAMQDGEDMNVRLGKASAHSRLDRFALNTLVQAVSDGFSGKPMGPDEMMALARQLLGGLEIGLELQGLDARFYDDPPFKLGSNTFHVAFRDLDAPLSSVSLKLGYGGVSGVPDVPAEIQPFNANMALNLTELPLVELIAASMGNGGDPMMALMQLAQQAVKLNIDAFDFDTPLGAFSMKGLAVTEAPTAQGVPPGARLNADIDIRDLDAMANWAVSDLDEAERKDMLAAVAMLKAVGEEEKLAGNSVLHRFKVEANSTGQLTINGKDMAPLMEAMMGGESQPQ